MSYITQNACSKRDTSPTIKNRAEYTMICKHYLEWCIVLEISNEISKKIKRKEIMRGDLQKKK